MAISNIVRVLGINSDEDYCQCCGKQNLKKVVWVEMENGEIAHLGTTCATKKHLRIKLSCLQTLINDAVKDEAMKIAQSIKSNDKRIVDFNDTDFNDEKWGLVFVALMDYLTELAQKSLVQNIRVWDIERALVRMHVLKSK